MGRKTKYPSQSTDFHALVEFDPTITEYPINSYVLFTPPVGRSDKLLPRHRGPYQVMDKANSISGKYITTHIHNLWPFNYDPDGTSPLTVAQHNEQEFVVESITAIATKDRPWSSKFAGLASAIHAILGNLTRPSCTWTSFTTT